jgi:hypothetical protein
VLQVFETFVWELTEDVCRRQDHWPADRLRSEAAGFLDRLIKHVYWEYPQSVPVPGDVIYRDTGAVRLQHFSEPSEDLRSFKADVHDELRRYRFWKNLQQNIMTLADATDEATALTPADVMDPAEPREPFVPEHAVPRERRTRKRKGLRSSNPLHAHRWDIVHAYKDAHRFSGLSLKEFSPNLCRHARRHRS